MRLDGKEVVHTLEEFIALNAGGLPSEGELTRIWNTLPEVYFYSSRADTLEHIKEVNSNLIESAKELLDRAKIHDESKLFSPEVVLFDEMTPKLKNLIYGTEEYKKSLEKLKPALSHHYRNNSHHPEHYDNGINGMNLYDLVEMFCDWQAAVKRNKNGDLMTSIDINKERFGMSEQLVSIFKNTCTHGKNNKK